MVRLEGVTLALTVLDVRCFNSYMVRLEVFRRFRLHPSETVFQFLYGAIGRFLHLPFYSLTDLFQFLYGAIGRFIVQTNFGIDKSFNSYMVRLEG